MVVLVWVIHVAVRKCDKTKVQISLNHFVLLKKSVSCYNNHYWKKRNKQRWEVFPTDPLDMRAAILVEVGGLIKELKLDLGLRGKAIP